MLEFATEAEAEARSIQQAIIQGCDLSSTKYYWSMEEGEACWCLMIPEHEESFLSNDEKKRLKWQPFTSLFTYYFTHG